MSSNPYSGFGELSTSQWSSDLSASRVTRIRVTSSSTIKIRFGALSGTGWTLARKRHAFQAFPMQQQFGELTTALRERLAIIADEESRRDLDQHMARLQDVSQRIEALEQQLSPMLDPQLRHYLQRRSYSKALAHIESQ
jgi:hypothetical protein